ncbi:hypothetical protein B0H34DRAFT_282409 [Crassisporium funariophilum]|nr:hypothetical protein B0H34DRAFT_282409 [Crassisporium funariophilum]
MYFYFSISPSLHFLSSHILFRSRSHSFPSDQPSSNCFSSAFLGFPSLFFLRPIWTRHYTHSKRRISLSPLHFTSLLNKGAQNNLLSSPSLPDGYPRSRLLQRIASDFLPFFPLSLLFGSVLRFTCRYLYLSCISSLLLCFHHHHHHHLSCPVLASSHRIALASSEGLSMLYFLPSKAIVYVYVMFSISISLFPSFLSCISS